MICWGYSGPVFSDRNWATHLPMTRIPVDGSYKYNNNTNTNNTNNNNHNNHNHKHNHSHNSNSNSNNNSSSSNGSNNNNTTNTNNNHNNHNHKHNDNHNHSHNSNSNNNSSSSNGSNNNNNNWHIIHAVLEPFYPTVLCFWLHKLSHDPPLISAFTPHHIPIRHFRHVFPMQCSLYHIISPFNLFPHFVVCCFSMF